jgi:hypothetical protein
MEKQPTQKPRRATGRHLNHRARAEHLTRWEQSGLTARAYAHEHGVSYKSLYAWRSQSRRAATGSSSTPDAAAFVPVRVSALALNDSQESLKIILGQPRGSVHFFMHLDKPQEYWAQLANTLKPSPIAYPTTSQPKRPRKAENRAGFLSTTCWCWSLPITTGFSMPTGTPWNFI